MEEKIKRYVPNFGYAKISIIIIATAKKGKKGSMLKFQITHEHFISDQSIYSPEISINDERSEEYEITPKKCHHKYIFKSGANKILVKALFAIFPFPELNFQKYLQIS